MCLKCLQRLWEVFLRLNFLEFSVCFSEQHPHHSSLKEEVSDVVRQKKKYLKKPKLECVVTPQPLAEPLPVLSKSDIKQYDFHSSDEDEFPQVTTKISLHTRQEFQLAAIRPGWLVPALNIFKSSLNKLSFPSRLCFDI